MKEHFFQCPYCWETISMLVDTSVSTQTYIEDCEVCCNPLSLTIRSQNDDIVGFDAEAVQ